MSENVLKSYNSKLATEQNISAFYTLKIDGDDLYDSTTRYIVLDKVDNVKINLNSQLTSYPLINGDVITDHKYDNPATLSISGVFSLNGKFNDSFRDTKDDPLRLVNIEDYFENVKKYGKTITLISQLSGQDRFKQRSNLILKDISFNHNLNSIKFDFSLQEVYFATFSTEVQIDEDLTDPDMPSLLDFKALDFTDEVLTKEGIYSMVVQQMNDLGLIENNFYATFIDTCKSGIVYFASLAAVSTTTLIGILAVTGAIGESLGLLFTGQFAALSLELKAAATLGTIAGGVPILSVVVATVAIIAVIGISIFLIYRAINRAKYIDSFKAYQNEDDNTNEARRFIKTLQTVSKTFDSVESAVQCYGFTSNHKKQEMYLTIDNVTYIFYFEYNGSKWQMKMTTTDDQEVTLRGSSDMIGNYAILDCKPSDAFYITDDYTYCYLINKALPMYDLDDDSLLEMLVDEFKAGNISYLGFDDEEIKNGTDSDGNPTTSFKQEMLSKFRNEGLYKDLTKFTIVITRADMEELQEKMNEEIRNTLKKDSGVW